VRQARVWRLSCLLRAPTGDGDVWFKANTTSPLFVNEGVVMGALAGLFPGRVPAPLAVEPERAWMVLADFGEEVRWEAPMEVVEEVAQTYARMQVEATAGLPGVDAATWLSPDEEAGLRAAVPGLQARCAELAGHAVPPALVHGDLHLSNVARRPGGYLFFDWTDACVAHPFLDLLADHGHRLLGDYRFDPHSGRWRHRLAPPDPVPPLSELLDGRAGPDPRPGAGEDALAGHLGQARALLGAAGPFTPVAGPSWLPPELERLRDFHLPGDAAS
jgi:hypothetical protein